MYLTKREFWKRKNKKHIYQTYKDHWSRFIGNCEVLCDKIWALDKLIDEHKETEHVYRYLVKVKDDATSLSQYVIACKYSGATVSDMLLSFDAYKDLMFKCSTITRSIGKIDSAILLCDMLEKCELTIRK